ncbi:hypothetical protein BHE74_00031252, partial [Ensete ventricosum]
PPTEVNPSLESCEVLTLGIRAVFLAPRCPSTSVATFIHHLLNNSHNCCDHRQLVIITTTVETSSTASTKITSGFGIYLTTTVIYVSNNQKE